MADALAYEVVPTLQVMTLAELARFLPAAAQVRFDKQIDVLPQRIAERIRSFEL
jgi:hypothetical protein